MTKHPKTPKARLARKDDHLRMIIGMARSKPNSDQKAQLEVIIACALRALDA